MHRHLMAPPDSDRRPQRGLMAPDPEHSGEAPDLRVVLWFVAAVLLLVEVVLNALA